MQAQLIALDWGTTSLRAYRLGEHGQVLEQRALSAGIMQLPTTPRLISGQLCSDGFELAFDQACGDWLDAEPGLPVIACGMVGSAQGWREAAYRETPASVNELSAALQTVRSQSGVTVHIIPGVLQRATLPNVMRGEETQVTWRLAAAGQPLEMGASDPRAYRSFRYLHDRRGLRRLVCAHPSWAHHAARRCVR